MWSTAVARVNARLYELDLAARGESSSGVQSCRSPALRAAEAANDSAPEFTPEQRGRIEALLVSTGFA